MSQFHCELANNFHVIVYTAQHMEFMLSSCVHNFLIEEDIKFLSELCVCILLLYVYISKLPYMYIYIYSNIARAYRD